MSIRAASRAKTLGTGAQRPGRSHSDAATNRQAAEQSLVASYFVRCQDERSALATGRSSRLPRRQGLPASKCSPTRRSMAGQCREGRSNPAEPVMQRLEQRPAPGCARTRAALALRPARVWHRFAPPLGEHSRRGSRTETTRAQDSRTSLPTSTRSRRSGDAPGRLLGD